MIEDLHVVIMAGGAGVRFWPQSTRRKPKQFQDILGLGRTLLQQTYLRARKMTMPERIWVVTSEEYAELVYEQLPEIPALNVLLEPQRCNTAPCLALAGGVISRLDSNALMLVLPSDHLITEEGEFFVSVQEGVDFVRDRDALLTFGIRPLRPETGYGYIEAGEAVQGVRKGVVRVASFREKPDAAAATDYVSSGNYFWNAGIFLWRVSSLLSALSAYEPEIMRSLESTFDHFGSVGFQESIERAYALVPVISIDYAVLERAENVYMLPANFGWSDLGSWRSVWELSERDDDENALMGKVMIQDSENCLVSVPEGVLGVVVGLEGYMVVHSGSSLLVCPMARDQEIRAIVSNIEKYGNQEFT